MKKRKHTIYYYISVSLLVFFFVLISFSIILFQTNIGRNRAKKFLINEAKKYEIQLQIKTLKGLLPFEYKLEDVSIEYENKNITIDYLTFRIKFWPLFQKTLAFRLFEAKNISVITKNQKIQEKKAIEKFWFSPKFKIAFEKLKIKNYNAIVNSKNIKIDLNGKIIIEKDGKKIKTKLKISRESFKDSYVKFNIEGKKQTRNLLFS